MAAKDADREHLRYEIGDVVYHLLVVMARWGLTPDDLAEELAARRKLEPTTVARPGHRARAESLERT